MLNNICFQLFLSRNIILLPNYIYIVKLMLLIEKIFKSLPWGIFHFHHSLSDFFPGPY